MESPYNRPLACNLIDKAMSEWADQMQDSMGAYCGFSVEMRIYDALRRAGYLTEEAMVSSNDEPLPTSPPPPYV